MKKYLIAAAFLSGLGTAGIALADDDECRVPMADWQPRGAVREMAEAQGWTVRRIKTDDGCYEIKGRDVQGRKIEVKVDPATLAIVRIKYDDDDDDERRGRKQNQPMTGKGQSPANDLFVPGRKPSATVE